MSSRRLKRIFLRICIALFCMQTAVAAYACPAFRAALPAQADHTSHHGAAMNDCDPQPAGNAGDTAMCHQHYAGEQSVGSAGLASAATAPMLPVLVVSSIDAIPPVAHTVLPTLLQRSTAPPLSIRFQVLRI